MSENKQNRFSKALNLRRMSVRELCIMAMLVAITIALSYVSGFLRIGDSIKFNISFISVYIGAVLFGPIAGGVIAAMADVISFVANPTGAFIPVFTIMEFINGMFFGLLLFNPDSEKRSLIKVFVLALLCASLQFGVNMFWRTYELARLYYGGHFMPQFVFRLPGNVAMIICKVAVIMMLENHVCQLKKLVQNK